MAPTPTKKEVDLFYRCAVRRLDDAQVLFREGHSTGAIYLAGYTIECVLKALVLNSTSRGQLAPTLNAFRGRRGHDYEWLRSEYLRRSGGTIPAETTKHLALVGDWSTDMRYLPHERPVDDPTAFLNATESILVWAQNRLERL